MIAEPEDIDQVLDLALRIGDSLLSAGMSANDVVVAMLRITGAYGLERVHVDVNYTAIAASYYPGEAEQNQRAAPTTLVRVVKPEETDYSQVRALDRLTDAIQRGMPADRALARWQQIHRAPRPYPAWVGCLAHAGVAASAASMFTWSWLVLLLTFGTGIVVDRLLNALERRSVPPLFSQFAGGLAVTMVAAVVDVLAASPLPLVAGIDHAPIVVGGITMLVVGMTIVGAAQDAIDQFYVTASARVFEVVIRTAGIVIGIVAGLQLAVGLGTPLSISSDPIARGPLLAQFVGAMMISACYTLHAYADRVTIALAAAVSAVAWTVYTVLTLGGISAISAATLAALVAALAATVSIRRTSVPGFALVTAALLPLLPGMALYNGLLKLVGTAPGTRDVSSGGLMLFTAVGVALGIAAGGSLGTYAGRPLADQLRRIRYRRRDPAE